MPTCTHSCRQAQAKLQHKAVSRSQADVTRCQRKECKQQYRGQDPAAGSIVRGSRKSALIKGSASAAPGPSVVKTIPAGNLSGPGHIFGILSAFKVVDTIKPYGKTIEFLVIPREA
ncbi:UNVERIFIED_CONTAM: hypothetical protein K2H54_051258 [Gekko kuhli]